MADEEVRDDLFPDPQDERTGPLRLAEPTVHWFTEMTRPEAVEDRLIVNRWYSHFADPDKGLTSRLRSEDDAQHWAAFDELLVFKLLRSRNRDVRYEEGQRATDFRVYESQAMVASVEVLTLLEKGTWNREWRRYAEIADALNSRLQVQGYMIHVLDLIMPRTPPLAAMAEFARQFLVSLPSPAEVSATQQRGVPLPVTEFRDHDVRVVIEAIPLREGAPANEDPDARVVGMSPVIGGVVDSAHRLRTALRRKRASRYDLQERPYVVAVSNRDPVCSSQEWMNAFYGPDLLSLRPDDPMARSLSLDNHGHFGRDPFSGRIRASRISAAVVIEHRRPLSRPRVFRLDNPEAMLDLDDALFPYSKRLMRGPSGAWSWSPPDDAAEFEIDLD